MSAPAPATAPIRMHDALLINLVGAVLVDPCPDAAQLDEHVAAIARALPMVSRDALLIADLARAAGDLVAAYPLRRDRAAEGALNAWTRAQFDAGVALAQLLRWRAAQAHAQLYPAEVAL